MTEKYDFKAVEKKWRPYWEASDLYATGTDPDKPKHYILDFFPCPSGAGLSVGHCRNYIPTCIAARHLRMTGHNVLHPMGWDAFGLPAENYAIQHGVSPRITTQRQTANYRRQMQLIECSYDWSRQIDSTDPAYYRWTQWFFLLLYKRGLAYQAEGSQWWCPQCQTILANEQVEAGRCWRCDSEVTKKTLKQWYFRITAYADRLLEDLDGIDWPASIIQMQRNWIGRSEGTEIVFETAEVGKTSTVYQIRTFTTRPDTLFGVTFLALAPEHPLVWEITAPAQRAAVAAYIDEAKRRGEIERMATDRSQSGVFSGSYAIHPITGREIPIWVADYVLTGYGSGAVMGVPGHDERDFAFAQRYELPAREVISPDGAPQGIEQPFTDEGVMINAGDYNGLTSAQGRIRLLQEMEAAGWGQRRVTYKMRDWLISRQRYWGAPIPIVHCAACGTAPLPEEALPLRLPETDDFVPAGDGRSPLARLEEWVNITCPRCGGPAQRETDTMDGFACSSWYFLRFASPHEAERPFDPEAVKYWLPVDTYVGGAEHAVMHLLYARFWTKVMADARLIDFNEPFTRLRNQGVLQAPDGKRMSKSRGNVITPDEVVAAHGVDALRAYIVFMGPFAADVAWDEAGIKGVTRFLDRFWALASEMGSRQAEASSAAQPNREFARRRHVAIKRVSEDMAAFKFNTAVAALMEWLNELQAAQDKPIPAQQWRQALRTFCLLLAPIAPFITEEVWQTVLGHGESVHDQAWPQYDPALIQAEEVTVVIQVNGKVRDRVVVPAGSDAAALQDVALASDNVQRHVNGRAIRKIITIPDKLVNVVV